jgi:hypothetical protein
MSPLFPVVLHHCGQPHSLMVAILGFVIPALFEAGVYAWVLTRKD